MPAVSLTIDDLLPFAPNITPGQADLLITAVLARAALKAPCILSDDFGHDAAAMDIVRVAVLRRHLAGGGVVTEETIGPYHIKIDNRALVDSLFTGDEVAELQAMCAAEASTVPAVGPLFGFPECAPRWPDPAERRWRV